jgi:N-glycosylase/DNA lyase
MNSVIELVEELKRSDVKNIVDARMKEFEELGKKDNNEIFKELCFCFMTAGFNAEKSIKIQKEIGEGFISMKEEELAEKLAELGHRFPFARAKFIVAARAYKDNLKEILNLIESESEMRFWIVENIKGIGMKEASHFLRNIGYKNVAIIDFHIIDLIVKHGVIEKPKSRSLGAKKYLEIENLLKEISEKTDLNLGELDLYLWYKETGKVQK